MLSLMFATEDELGYDPTVQRRLDPEVNKICFVYEVNGRYYKTQKVIFEDRGLCITGRATRVWEVIQVASFDELQPLEGSHMVVLKDAWLDAGSMAEGDIQREMFADLDKVASALQAGVEPNGFTGMDDESKQMLRECLLARDWPRYFLTPAHEWQGTTSKEIAETAEPDSTLFGAPPSYFPYIHLSRPLEKEQFDRRHCPKQQSRVIFNQVCGFARRIKIGRRGDSIVILRVW